MQDPGRPHSGCRITFYKILWHTFIVLWGERGEEIFVLFRRCFHSHAVQASENLCSCSVGQNGAPRNEYTEPASISATRGLYPTRKAKGKPETNGEGEERAAIAVEPLPFRANVSALPHPPLAFSRHLPHLPPRGTDLITQNRLSC